MEGAVAEVNETVGAFVADAGTIITIATRLGSWASKFHEGVKKVYDVPDAPSEQVEAAEKTLIGYKNKCETAMVDIANALNTLEFEEIDLVERYKAKRLKGLGLDGKFLMEFMRKNFPEQLVEEAKRINASGQNNSHVEASGSKKRKKSQVEMSPDEEEETEEEEEVKKRNETSGSKKKQKKSHIDLSPGEEDDTEDEDEDGDAEDDDKVISMSKCVELVFEAWLEDDEDFKTKLKTDNHKEILERFLACGKRIKFKPLVFSRAGSTSYVDALQHEIRNRYSDDAKKRENSLWQYMSRWKPKSSTSSKTTPNNYKAKVNGKRKRLSKAPEYMNISSSTPGKSY